MAKKKRNHYVPRFLLRQFASRREGKKAWVWLFRRNGDHREVSVGDAGVASFFYGPPETGVEEGLSVIESEHAQVVERLLAGADPNTVGSPLSELVWLMAVRTENLRTTFGNMVSKGLDAMVESSSSESARAALKRKLDADFEKELDTVLDRLGPLGLAIRQQIRQQPGLVDHLRRGATRELEGLDLPDAVGSLLGEAFKTQPIDESLQDGHVRAMSKLLDENPVPDRFDSAKWQVVRFPERSLVLGDGLVIAFNKDGDVGHPIKFSKDWICLWIPIASDALLCANIGGTGHEVPSPDEVNRHSVLLAQSCCFAADACDANTSLMRLMGSGVPGLSDDEIKRIVENSWDGL